MSSCEKTRKTPVDDVIRSVLSGTQEKLALDFVSYLKSLRMTPQWASHHSWAVSYKGKRVCYIKISEKCFRQLRTDAFGHEKLAKGLR